jgi:hypothetical protein
MSSRTDLTTATESRTGSATHERRTTRRWALLTGIAYLVAIVMTPYSSLESALDRSDALALAQSASAATGVLRWSLARWLVVLVADLLVAWGLFELFSGHNPAWARLTSWTRAVFVAIAMVVALQLGNIAALVDGQAITPALAAQVDAAFTTYDLGFDVAFAWFGVQILALGWLVVSTRLVPTAIGWLLFVAGVGYQINAFASIMSPAWLDNEAAFITTVAIPGFLSEFGFAIWLLLRTARGK